MMPSASETPSSMHSGGTNTAAQDEAPDVSSPPSSTSPAAAGSTRRVWGLWLVSLLGAIVFMPALRAPFLLVDYLQASMIEGTFPAKRSPIDLYDFVNDGDRAALVDRGMLPWWSHPKLEIRFFR